MKGVLIQAVATEKMIKESVSPNLGIERSFIRERKITLYKLGRLWSNRCDLAERSFLCNLALVYYVLFSEVLVPRRFWEYVGQFWYPEQGGQCNYRAEYFSFPTWNQGQVIFNIIVIPYWFQFDKYSIFFNCFLTIIQFLFLPDEILLFYNYYLLK